MVLAALHSRIGVRFRSICGLTQTLVDWTFGQYFRQMIQSRAALAAWMNSRFPRA